MAMNNKIKYISKNSFHSGKQFSKINRHIETCLRLLERLIAFNNKCKTETSKKLKIEDYVIDYRTEQFTHYEKLLHNIYYSCFSLKHIYDISTFMNFRKIDNDIMGTLNNQEKHIAFTAIIKLSSIFEYTRKIYDEKTPTDKYFEHLKTKYSDKAESLELLKNFRNTIHSNGIWHPYSKTKKNLVYNLRQGQQIIKTGESIKYDYWKIYRIIKDCLELNMLMALDIDAARIRNTRFVINGERIAIVKVEAIKANDKKNDRKKS